ncbi:MAG: hypothetical protein ABL878_12175 [Burkholderiales bacterium]
MKSAKSAIEGAGAVFDRLVVELIFDPDTSTTKFAVADQGEVDIRDSVALPDGTHLNPIPATNNLLRHGVVRLPTGIGDYETLASLRADLATFIDRYVTLPPRFLPIAVHYVLLSWVYDGFNELPYLRFFGDYGSGKTRALNVIGSLLYKPLFASGATTISPLFHTLDLFQGSLVLDEADFRFSDERAEIAKILNNGNQRGFPVLRSVATPQKTYDPRAFHVFGPKLLAMRGHFSDLAIESRCLTARMDMVTEAGNNPVTLPPQFEGEAITLRNQLLRFRFHTRPHLPLPSVPTSPLLSGRGNQMLGALLSLIDDDPVKADIIAQLRDEEHARGSARLEDSAALVLDALLAHIKDGAKQVPIAAIRTTLIATHGAEFERPPTARYVGSILRTRFGLCTFKSHGTYQVTLPTAEALDRLRGRFGG